VDFATAASKNGVSITQQMCHDCCTIKDESKKNSGVFAIFIGFLVMGSL
jgi:hypothetical protein